jgi:methyl-accepting chemotaxis protein
MKLNGSVRNKILGAFVLGLAMVVAGALYGFAAARSGLQAIERVNDTLIAQSIDAQALESTFKEQVQQWMLVLVRGHDPAALEKSWKQFTFREREVRRAGEKLRDAVELPAAHELLDKFLASHKDMGEKYRAALETFKSSNFDAKKADAQAKGLELGPADNLEELVKVMQDAAQTSITAARKNANRALMVSLAVIGIATAIALVACGILIMRTVVRPLVHAVKVVDRIAAGDLTVDVKTGAQDETGRLLTGLLKMRDGLSDAVSVIRRSAIGVGDASRRIAADHSDLSARTEEQAASLEETASSMEELASTVRQNAQSAKEANSLATGSSDIANRGGKVMAEVAGTMSGISTASKRIADIVGVIDSIAFQTNILALNAAVEAARAGEQGRGFAVVASEVRALAQRSAEAAREIRSLIQDSVSRVDTGTRLVEQAAATMEEIVESVRRVTLMMSEISAASQEQLTGIDQVTGAVTQMDRVVQQNAGLVQESAHAADNMADQAESLMQSVARFKLANGAEPPEDQPMPVASSAPARIASPRAAPKKLLTTWSGNS